MKASVFIGIFLSLSSTIRAQALVPNFTLENVSGGTVSLSSFKEHVGVVLIFTKNNCPFDEYYSDRVISLAAAYAGRIQFFYINSAPDDQASFKDRKALYESHPPAFPYLVDADQAIMNTLGAKKSTEVFLLASHNGSFTVYYNGAIDDNPQSPQAVTATYLKTAIENLLAGKKNEIAAGRVAGCTIRKK